MMMYIYILLKYLTQSIKMQNGARNPIKTEAGHAEFTSLADTRVFIVSIDSQIRGTW